MGLESLLGFAKNTVKNAVYSAVAWASLAMPLPNCNAYNPPKYQDPQKMELVLFKESGYSLELFKKAIGRLRLEDQTEDRMHKFEKEWKFCPDSQKELLFRVYSDPNGVCRDLTREQKKEFDSFDPLKLSPKELERFESNLYWDLIPKNGKISKSDRLMIYLGKRLLDEDIKNIPVN